MTTKNNVVEKLLERAMELLQQGEYPAEFAEAAAIWERKVNVLVNEYESLKKVQMDPDENLEEQLTITKQLRRNPYDEESVFRLCELVENLNEWLCNGGFAPKAWSLLTDSEVVNLQEWSKRVLEAIPTEFKEHKNFTFDSVPDYIADLVHESEQEKNGMNIIQETSVTFDLLPSEEVLPDDYTVYAGYVYIVDGVLKRSDWHDISIKEFKMREKASEVRRCEIFGRTGARLGDKVKLP